ncbi:YfjI family protein [Microbulbifer sp. JSM ZJ756]|uniref:YfjI family protein n=1 Tax=Microbulbifer sp. JSM ZJ756 TaxID=3376191 RepID=UPI0037B01009
MTPATPDNYEWPDLVPFDRPDLPRLDVGLLSSWAGEFATAISAATETPPELAMGMVLVTCAAAAARSFDVRVKPGYHEPCNLWIVAALPPGNRKSAIQSAATHPLVEWEREQAKRLQPEIDAATSDRKTMEARANRLRRKAANEEDLEAAKQLAKEAADLEAKLPHVPVAPQIWTSDATPERLGNLLADQDECMAWLSSEGGVFDLLQGRYSGGIPNLDLILKSHSGDAERVDRGSRPPVYLRKPRLSIGLSPQPDVLRGLASIRGFRGRGLLGRFLYLLPPSPLGYRSLENRPVPAAVSNNYRAGLAAMLNQSQAAAISGEATLKTVRLSRDALELWHEFAMEVERQMKPGGEFESITDWASKAPGAAARISGVLHGIIHAHGVPWEEEITAETVGAACEITSVISRHSLAAMDMMGADDSVAAAQTVLRWIERRQLDNFRIREAFNALKGTFPRVEMLRKAIATLEERGYVKVTPLVREGRGRPPSPLITVRPGLFGAAR